MITGEQVQYMIDGLNASQQRARAETQMTLGSLIAGLEAMPDADVANLRRPHSYRGYYCDLAFERHEGTRPAVNLLSDCYAAMGRVFEGWKGGDFVMGERTPVWIASAGNTGERLIAIHSHGEIDTAKEED